MLLYKKRSCKKINVRFVCGPFVALLTLELPQQEWLKILQEYIIPMQMRVFEGYKSKSEAYLSFIVKYSMTGQKKLVPHHDASTFTTNTALNRAHIDYSVSIFSCYCVLLYRSFHRRSG